MLLALRRLKSGFRQLTRLLRGRPLFRKKRARIGADAESALSSFGAARAIARALWRRLLYGHSANAGRAACVLMVTSASCLLRGARRGSLLVSPPSSALEGGRHGGKGWEVRLTLQAVFLIVYMHPAMLAAVARDRETDVSSSSTLERSNLRLAIKVSLPVHWPRAVSCSIADDNDPSSTRGIRIRKGAHWEFNALCAAKADLRLK